MSVYGEALRAYDNGDRDAVLQIVRDDGFVSDVPVSVFFHGPDEWFPVEVEILSRCRGRVLDVGAGAGMHARWLEEHGFDVTAIDVAPAAVDIMRRSGLRDARLLNVWDLQDELFDTIVVLGRSIGIAGDLAGLERLLTHLGRLMADGGQILLTSLDVARGGDPSHESYVLGNVREGRYPGEVRFRESFGGVVGPLVRWLYVDPASLADVAGRCGLQVEVLRTESDGNYAAQASFWQTPRR